MMFSQTYISVGEKHQVNSKLIEQVLVNIFCTFFTFSLCNLDVTRFFLQISYSAHIGDNGDQLSSP